MELTESAPAGVAFRVAESILDRSGTARKDRYHGDQKSGQTTVNTIVFDRPQMELILETAREVGAREVIDAYSREANIVRDRKV